MPFAPGQSGNPGGRARAKPFNDALRMELAQFGNPTPLPADANGLRHVARALIAKAVQGDAPSIKEIADRIDGKVPQAITGDGDNPLSVIHRIERVIVTAAQSAIDDDAQDRDRANLPAPT